MSALLLSELLPLRTTRMLGDFAEDLPLPIVFGDLTEAPFPLIRLSDTRFFAADHPMEVTRAFTERQETFDWALYLQSDETGATWTEVWFSAPIPPGTEVSACGRGKLDDSTGALVENPADVANLITRLAGRADDWTDLRAECSGLKAAGRIYLRQSIKSQLDDVLTSFGIIWNQQMARRYPTTADPLPILDLDEGEVAGIRVSASLNDTADVLRLAYDRSDATGRAQHYIELTASPQRYGGLSKEVFYPYLRTPADAEAVGRPVLQRLAGERYDVTLASTRKSIRPGQWIRPVAHREWPLPGDDPVIMVLTVEIDPGSDSVNVAGETVLGDLPVVTVTAHSIALPDTVEATVEVSVRDGIATFTFHDEDGRPLPGARVSLDGGPPKTTNAQGKVTFEARAGVHELAVEAFGYTPFTVRVTL